MFFFTMSVPASPCFPLDSPLIGGRITEGGGYFVRSERKYAIYKLAPLEGSLNSRRQHRLLE